MSRSPRPNRIPAGGACGGNSSVSDWLACAGLDTFHATRMQAECQVTMHYQLLDFTFASMSKGLKLSSRTTTAASSLRKMALHMPTTLPILDGHNDVLS